MVLAALAGFHAVHTGNRKALASCVVSLAIGLLILILGTLARSLWRSFRRRERLGVGLAACGILSDKLLGGIVLLEVTIARPQPAIKRRKDTVFKDFRLCLEPVL